MEFKIDERAEQTSKIRKGTCCQICGRPIEAYDNIVKADGGCKGGTIYAHRECCVKHNYSTEFFRKRHKETYSGFQFGCEFETNSRTTAEQRLQLFAWYGILCTSDCTVSEEFKGGIVQGLHGIKDYLNGINKIIDIATGDNIGTHANVSLNSWTMRDIYAMQFYSNRLFAPLADAIDRLTDYDRDNIFGRDFGAFREYTTHNFVHGYWLCIKPDPEHNTGCLEFRISKYRNTEQYAHLLMLYKEWCLIIDKTLLKGEHDPDKAAQRMIHALELHKNGLAKYQYRERNTK